MKTKTHRNHDELSYIKRNMINTDIQKKNINLFKKNYTVFETKKRKGLKNKKSVTLAKSTKTILSRNKNADTKLIVPPNKKTTFTNLKKLKDEGKNNSDKSSSDVSSISNSLNKKNPNNNLNKKNENKKENKNKNSDKDSAFQSSVFSESQSNDDICLDKKFIPNNFKSSKNINFFEGVNKYNKFIEKNKKNNNERDNLRKSTNKKIGINEKNDIKNKDKKEKIKDSDNSKVKSFHLEDESNSEVKLKRINNKKKVGFTSQFQISRNVNNICIFPKKEIKKDTKNNLYDSNNHNMNIINPGNFIAIEYNINHGKKRNKNLDLNNNVIYNNNEQNDLLYSKRETNNDYTQINNNNNRIQFKYNEKIESGNSKKSNVVKGKKKPKKKSFFCCL
jgi:hypothetical protein